MLHNTVQALEALGPVQVWHVPLNLGHPLSVSQTTIHDPHGILETDT